MPSARTSRPNSAAALGDRTAAAPSSCAIRDGLAGTGRVVGGQELPRPLPQEGLGLAERLDVRVDPLDRVEPLAGQGGEAQADRHDDLGPDDEIVLEQQVVVLAHRAVDDVLDRDHAGDRRRPRRRARTPRGTPRPRRARRRRTRPARRPRRTPRARPRRRSARGAGGRHRLVSRRHGRPLRPTAWAGRCRSRSGSRATCWIRVVSSGCERRLGLGRASRPGGSWSAAAWRLAWAVWRLGQLGAGERPGDRGQRGEGGLGVGDRRLVLVDRSTRASAPRARPASWRRCRAPSRRRWPDRGSGSHRTMSRRRRPGRRLASMATTRDMAVVPPIRDRTIRYCPFVPPEGSAPRWSTRRLPARGAAAVLAGRPRAGRRRVRALLRVAVRPGDAGHHPVRRVADVVRAGAAGLVRPAAPAVPRSRRRRGDHLPRDGRRSRSSSSPARASR